MNRVLISDPTIKLSTDLRLAWYGGSAQQPALQDEIATLLGRLHLESERMLLFGPSGGGFAALMQAALLPETTALVSNPQTDVTRYTRAAVDRYLTTAWQIDAMDEDTVLPFRHEVVSHYAKEGSARTVYLQNAGDADHIEKHYAPFRREAHPGRRIEYILPNLGPGHIGADRESFTRLLELMRDLVDWNELVKALRGVTVTRNV